MAYSAHAHVVLIGAGVEGGDFLTSYKRVQSLRDIGYPNSKVRGARAIYNHAQLRFSRNERRVGVYNVRNRLHLRQQSFGVFRQLLEVGAADDILNVGVSETAAGNCCDLLHARS